MARYRPFRYGRADFNRAIALNSISERLRFGFRDVAPGDKQAMVDDVFASVARRYDLMNDLMSGGMHRLWKGAMVSALNPPKRGAAWRLLDAAAGTGDIALRVAERSAGHADIALVDTNASMLDIARKRAAKRGFDGIALHEASAEALPFADGAFDAYTIAFGIRNVPQVEQALREAWRALKHGGRFLCLEFSEVDTPMLDRLYEAYSFRVIPELGRTVAGDAESYRYLVESIRTFPNQERFADMIRSAGFERVSYRNFSGGIAALHSGWKL
jgi:demethylmenaquinone methyltransferase/2-methoxy-6-polyprenyl-1,4-benzoquinol methylase